MKLTPEAARGVVECWRSLAELLDNQTARTFVALVDAMPADDPELYVSTVAALLGGLPRQLAEATELIRVSGEYLTPGGPLAPELSARPSADVDPLAFLGDEASRVDPDDDFRRHYLNEWTPDADR